MCVYFFYQLSTVRPLSSGRGYKVPPQNTSQVCSRCGSIVKKDLSVRIHNCPHCGLVVDRDINAAVNILNKSNFTVGTTGGVMTEVITPTLVEMSLIRGIN